MKISACFRLFTFSSCVFALSGCGDDEGDLDPGPGSDPANPEPEIDVYARPGLVTVRGSTLVVALNRLSVSFDAALPGQLALVDIGTSTTPGSPAGSERFGIVRTDFESTAIATLDDAGAVIDPAILDSGSTPPGLTATLSGDVVLADTLGGGSGILTIVDRFGTDVVTRLEVEGPTVAGQINVAPETSDFSTNPQDVEIVSATSAWVSRFSVNLDPDATGLELANDVVEINPTTFALTGRRVDLSMFDSLESSGMEDEDTLQPVAFALPESTRNCGVVRPVPDSTDLVLVGCQGFGQPFGEPVQVRATSGVFVVQITGTEAVLVDQYLPSDDAQSAVAVVDAVPLDDTSFVAIQNGSGGGGDAAYLVDLETGSQSLLVESSQAFSLGTPAFDPSTGVLVLPDSAEDGGVRRFTRASDGSFTAGDVVTFSDGPLPPARAYLLP